ncbi:(2Fe-2S)-binding protein [Brevibacillus fluminis]|uniref:(2Fe-2S)-binding protein n=1 Tax=Brevibacillus fluminis TaxID=511487 RepID=A0A3M8D0M4_9BACL|nr:2Fe-2S iron-sulfur cluster-binding protein [Brevibacillus fluminis]RNB81620.1 (2Fe-2S)-binding protein [Brevibacillus fluminis]
MGQLILHTRQGLYETEATIGEPIVKLAKKQKIPWGHSCERGICAQCRTKVLAGAEFLNDITDAEKLRLRKAERQEGFRLGCQIQIKSPGKVELVHKPY